MRVFLAIRFSKTFQAAIENYMLELKRLGVRGDYTGSDNLHLTLAFVGETDSLAEIREAVRATPVTPFEISLRDTGGFGSILWLGTDAEVRLKELADRLRSNLTARGVQFDSKPFKSHITIIRKVDIPHVTLPEPPGAAMQVERISVMKSERINGILRYTEI